MRKIVAFQRARSHPKRSTELGDKFLKFRSKSMNFQKKMYSFWWYFTLQNGGKSDPRVILELKKWKFNSKTARRVLQTCPLVLKLCEVAVLISFTTSESFVQKYSFLVKLSRIFDVALKWFPLCVYCKQKHCFRATSKILDNFAKNEYFWMKFSEVVKLVSTATSQSLSTNGQVWTTLRAVLDLNSSFSVWGPVFGQGLKTEKLKTQV